MTKAPLPRILNRGGIKRTFQKVNEGTWDSLFDREKTNGLAKLRVPGHDKYAYYDVERVMTWLLEKNFYRRFEFYEPGEILHEGPLQVRRHVMMGV